VRTAAYRPASPFQRQDVHRALAEVTGPRRDPDRRAWHRAHAAAGPDEDVAEELERSAGTGTHTVQLADTIAALPARQWHGSNAEVIRPRQRGSAP